MAVLTLDWINKTVNRLRSDNREDIRIVLIELMELFNGEMDQEGDKEAGSVQGESQESGKVDRRVRKPSVKQEVKSKHQDKAPGSTGKNPEKDEKEEE